MNQLVTKKPAERRLFRSSGIPASEPSRRRNGRRCAECSNPLANTPSTDATLIGSETTPSATPVTAGRYTAEMRPTSVFIALLLSAHTDAADAGDWNLPSDVGVTLQASPSIDLQPGQPVDMTFSATNYGDEEIPVLITGSSRYVDELTIASVDPDECQLIVLEEKLSNGGYDYLMEWFVSGPEPTFDPPLAPGETRACHFQIALTRNAPPAFNFSFGLAEGFHDPDPNNDQATVILQRAVATPTPVPTLSVTMLWLLAALSAVVGMIALKTSGRAGRRSSTLAPCAAR
jgi:hypothetical protein